MLILFSLACKSNINEDDFDRLDIFCDTPEEEYAEEYIDGGASGNSGKLEAQLMSNADYPRDLTFIEKSTYILENLAVGGGESRGQADALGTIESIRGGTDPQEEDYEPGPNWSMRLEGPTGCLGEIEFELKKQQTLRICVPLVCEE